MSCCHMRRVKYNGTSGSARVLLRVQQLKEVEVPVLIGNRRCASSIQQSTLAKIQEHTCRIPTSNKSRWSVEGQEERRAYANRKRCRSSATFPRVTGTLRQAKPLSLRRCAQSTARLARASNEPSGVAIGGRRVQRPATSMFARVFRAVTGRASRRDVAGRRVLMLPLYYYKR